MQTQYTAHGSCFAVLCWHSQRCIAPFYALSMVLTTPQVLYWSNFIAAFDAPMGTLRAEATLGGGRLAVGPVDAEATLSGAGPLGLVHIHAQICALHFIVFTNGRRGNFRCCSTITGTRLPANGDNRYRHHAQRHQQGHRVEFHVHASKLELNSTTKLVLRCFKTRFVWVIMFQLLREIVVGPRMICPKQHFGISATTGEVLFR